MEHIAAFLLIVGCSPDLAECREMPTPTAIYETIEDCEAERPAISARHEDAARWFRVALERERNEAVRLGVRRELVELLIHRMGEPQRALPELARIADGHAGTPAGAWAKAEMADIRQRMRSGQDHG